MTLLCRLMTLGPARDGGAIFIALVDSVVVNQTKFLQCEATEGDGGGAVVCLTSGRTGFSETNFSDCASKERAAGLYIGNVHGDSIEMEHSFTSSNSNDPRFYLMTSCVFDSCHCARSVKGSGGGCYVDNANSSQQPVASECDFIQCRSDSASGGYWACGYGHLKNANSPLFIDCNFELNIIMKIEVDVASDIMIVDSHGIIREPENIFLHCFTSCRQQSAILVKADSKMDDISYTLTRVQRRTIAGTDGEDNDDTCGSLGAEPCETIYFAVQQKFPLIQSTFQIIADVLTKETHSIVLQHSNVVIYGKEKTRTVIDTTQGIISDYQSSSSLFVIADKITTQIRDITFFINESSCESTSMTLFEVIESKPQISLMLFNILFTTEYPTIFESSFFSHSSSNSKFSISRPLFVTGSEAEVELYSCDISHLTFEGASFYARSDQTGSIHLEATRVVKLQRTDAGTSDHAAALVSDLSELKTTKSSVGMCFTNCSFSDCGNEKSAKGGVICTVADDVLGCFFIETNFTNCFCANYGKGGAVYIDISLHGASISKLASITFNLVQSSSNRANVGPLAFLYCKDENTQLNDILFHLDTSKIKEHEAIAAMSEGDTNFIDVIKVYASTRFTNVYVSDSSKDTPTCGEQSNPCYSLAKGVSHLSFTQYGILFVIDRTTLISDIRLTNSGLSQQVIGSTAKVLINSSILSASVNQAVIECAEMSQMQRLAFSFTSQFETIHEIFIHMKDGNLSFDSCGFKSEEGGNVAISPILISIERGKLVAINTQIHHLDLERELMTVDIIVNVNLTSTRIFEVNQKTTLTKTDMIKIVRFEYDPVEHKKLIIDHFEVTNVKLNDGVVLKIVNPYSSSSFSGDSPESSEQADPTNENESSIDLTSFSFNKIDAGPHSEGLVILQKLKNPIRIIDMVMKECLVSFCLGCAVNVENCSITFDQCEFSGIQHRTVDNYETDYMGKLSLSNSDGYLVSPSMSLLTYDILSNSFSKHSKKIFNGDPPTPCKWKTGAIFASYSQNLKLTNVSFQTCSVGGLYILETNTIIDDCSFSLNSPKFEGFPSALHNIRCIDSDLSVEKLKSGDGVETGSSLWMQRENCTVGGSAIKDEFPLLFKPTLNSVGFEITDNTPTFFFSGEKLIACNLTFEVNYTSNGYIHNQVYEFSKHVNETYAEGVISMQILDDMDKGTSLSVTLLYWKTEEQQERIQIFVPYISNKQKSDTKMPLWAIILIAGVCVLLVALTLTIVIFYTKKIKTLKTQLSETEPLIYKSDYSLNTMNSMTATTTNEFRIPFDSQEPWMEE
ncbi:uncharacterized protein MONOS_7191 [Monocercomonoides exilis]|uniref:uncharacterized protein n=1 Tax=Monocercomonoides exilis TaxID=2049356 RepID=UPI003559920C|nr:hypothetical protein MONOS_7191 [Monocercomonoides exilis]|eukprot:MONOS_7191.1-p1 / transcript=MONOS_7191.1 / gene=MONOS_7191 / organism=Monocercomonoides_exilis_PA203 / gene_product=unspecified product / transcript_product=unspecified product / location=Mono_scaffold00240:39538-43523(-) / protein_length=1302 / sequence_SO=supercontig / SO=protein_coding / is_pseudo=false